MTVILLRVRQGVDATKLAEALAQVGIETLNVGCEVKGGDCEIVAVSPGIHPDMLPEGFSFGNGATVSGDIAWIVVDPAERDHAVSVMDRLTELVG